MDKIDVKISRDIYEILVKLAYKHKSQFNNVDELIDFILRDMFLGLEDYNKNDIKIVKDKLLWCEF